MGDTASMSGAQSARMMNASLATSAISPILTTVESIGSIKAQGDYASTIANTNAALGKLKAFQTIQSGDIEASRENIKTKGAVGSFRAQAGDSGVDVNSGSTAGTQADIKTAGAIDELTIRNNAARQAWGFETQSIQDTFQGQFEKFTAGAKVQQSIATGGLQAVAGPLGIYGNYLRWSRYMGGGGGGGGGIVMPWSSAPTAPSADAGFDMRTS